MRRLIFLASLSSVLVATLAIAPVQAGFPGADGLIAYTEFPFGGNGVIATFDPTTKERKALTTSAQSPHGDYEPAWSPGGAFIVFTRLSATSADVWRMDADGSNQKRLTTHSAWDDNPAFSPGGSRIVFSTDRNGQFDLYSMDIDGGSVRRLTTSSADDFAPVWSPDNDRIAFVSGRRANYEIYTMKPDGSGQKRVTDNDDTVFQDVYVDYHPDGDTLVIMRVSSSVTDYNIVVGPEGGDYVIHKFETTEAELGGAVFAPASTPSAGLILFHQWGVAGNYFDLAQFDLGDGTLTDVTTFAGAEVYPDWQPIPDFPLVDARFSTFEADIEWVYAEGITVGCSAERYCTGDPVTRAQMAIFLDRALPLPDTTTDYYTDDNGKTGEAAINRLAAAGITGGCAPNKYCPTAPVTRGQMAAFLSRALDLPPTNVDHFTDDETSTFEPYINRVAAAGITGGCGGGKYCPLRNVTRGEMAAFLRRALE